MADYYSPIIGVLGIFQDAEGRVLLQRRSAENHFAPGLFGLPGGHFEPGESTVSAARRELAEELGVEPTVTPENVLGVVDEQRTNEPGRVHFVVHVTEWKGELRVTEPTKHSEIRWVHPRELPDDALAQVRAAVSLLVDGKHYVSINQDPLVG